MKKEDFATTILVDAIPQQVFNAINNVRGWWSENIEGDTDELHSEFKYHYQDVHRAKMWITEFVTNKKVVWHVMDNYTAKPAKDFRIRISTNNIHWFCAGYNNGCMPIRAIQPLNKLKFR